MVAAGPSKLLVPPIYDALHSITEDIFIVTTVRTSELTMAFSCYFSFIWEVESSEVQAFNFDTYYENCVYTCILYQFSASKFIFQCVTLPKQ